MKQCYRKHAFFLISGSCLPHLFTESLILFTGTLTAWVSFFLSVIFILCALILKVSQWTLFYAVQASHCNIVIMVLPTCISFWKSWPQNKTMQITLALKRSATVPGETERHKSVSGTATAAGAAQPSCKVLCWGWAGGSKPRAGSLEGRRGGDQGIWHNHRGETKSKRQNKRKCMLKLEGNQSERNRCGQVDKWGEKTISHDSYFQK